MTDSSQIPSNIIRLVFTKTDWSIPSLVVRYALPRSRFVMGISSHVLIDFGDVLYEALPGYGVRKSIRSVALSGSTIVDTVDFVVPNQAAGRAFLEAQLGKGYDYIGVLGLAIDPSRNWNDDTNWFCYELSGGCLKASGLDLFSSLNHLTESPLLALKASV